MNFDCLIVSQQSTILVFSVHMPLDHRPEVHFHVSDSIEVMIYAA